MKKAILVFTFLVVLVNTRITGQDIGYLRTNFDKTVHDKQLCRSLIDGLTDRREGGVYKAYLGAFQTIWANHTGNPFAKLSTFYKGKNNIEEAVKSDPQSVEIRILRLSVQKNCPGFLGYKGAIKEDTGFLAENINSIASPDLLKLAVLVLNAK
jgi:hypothetical protein